MIYLIGYGRILLNIEALSLLLYFSGFSVDAEPVLNDGVLYPRHFFMNLGEHILVLDKETF